MSTSVDMPKATFTSRRLAWRDTWELHAGYVRCRSFLLGRLMKVCDFPLCRLSPTCAHFTDRNLLLTGGVVVLVLGVLGWVGTVWIASQSPNEWAPVRSFRLIVWGMLGILMSPLDGKRCIGFGGASPHVYIRYARRDRPGVDLFVQKVVQEIKLGHCL